MPGGLGMPVKLNSTLPYFWRIVQFCRQNTHFLDNSSLKVASFVAFTLSHPNYSNSAPGSRRKEDAWSRAWYSVLWCLNNGQHQAAAIGRKWKKWHVLLCLPHPTPTNCPWLWEDGRCSVQGMVQWCLNNRQHLFKCSFLITGHWHLVCLGHWSPEILKINWIT